jgi:hypothetical protein
MPTKKLAPGDDKRGTPDHHIDGFEGLLLAGRELRYPLDQEFQVGLDGTEIDVFGLASGHQEGVMVIWRAMDRARTWLRNS